MNIGSFAKRFCSACAFLFLCSIAIAQRAAVPAQIVTAAPASGSVGFVTIAGSTLLNAQIGRWDTPYPYPDTGQIRTRVAADRVQHIGH